LNERLKYQSKTKASNRSAADKIIANSVISLFDRLNGIQFETNFDWDKWTEISPLMISLLLRHEFFTIPQKSRDIQKWVKQGLMGVELLKEEKFGDFLQWVKGISLIYSKIVGSSLNQKSIIDFYKSVGIIIRYSRLAESINYKKYLDETSTFLEDIDPETFDADIKQSDNFKQILTLSQISKLISQQYTTTNVSSVVEDFILLKKGRCPSITYTSGISDEASFFEIKGTLQMFLEKLWSNICGKDVSSQPVEVHISTAINSQTNIVSLVIDSQSITQNEYNNIFQNRLLFNFITESIIGFNVNTLRHRITLSFQGYTSPIGDNLSQKCLKSFFMGSPSLSNESYTISRLLHDLKNQLLAFQVCINAPADDRTSRLRNKLDASQHLDHAIKLCTSARIISKSLSQPEISEFDVNQLISNFISEKIKSLPVGIRISPPKTSEFCSFSSSKLFLNSIIENIFKNSIEAFSEEGEVSIDWIYDNDDRQLLLEIKDDGPGIDEITLKSILAGEIIDSKKENGSGIGMLTVKAMLDRIGGSIAAESVLGAGCRWTILLDDLHEADPLSIAEIEQGEKSLDIETSSKESVI
jgi:two-component sensor histidine kinase